MIVPITSDKPHCFGVCCARHGECARYVEVDGSETDPHANSERKSYRDANDMPTERSVLEREWTAMRKALSYRAAPPSPVTELERELSAALWHIKNTAVSLADAQVIALEALAAFEAKKAGA